MNYETAIELAHQRMREIGKNINEYHIEAVSIASKRSEGKKPEIIIKAYNEYYYLVNYEIYSGFVILSDTGFFNADEYSENTLQEFTGLIRIIPQAYIAIEVIGGQYVKAIDFIKVTIH